MGTRNSKKARWPWELAGVSSAIGSHLKPVQRKKMDGLVELTTPEILDWGVGYSCLKGYPFFLATKYFELKPLHGEDAIVIIIPEHVSFDYAETDIGDNVVFRQVDGELKMISSYP